MSQLAATPHFQGIGRAETMEVLQHIIDVIAVVPLGDPQGNTPTWSSVARRACEAITSVSHENKAVKKLVNDLGGIPPLVRLLSSHDSKVQRAGASVLRTLAFKEESNKMAIMKYNALPKLIEMLKSEVWQCFTKMWPLDCNLLELHLGWNFSSTTSIYIQVHA